MCRGMFCPRILYVPSKFFFYIRKILISINMNMHVYINSEGDKYK